MKVKCLICLMGWNMARAQYMILANTIKKLWDLGGWHLAVTAQILTRTVDHTILEKCQSLRMNIQVLNQKLEPLMHAVVSNDMAAQEKAVPAGFNYMWFQMVFYCTLFDPYRALEKAISAREAFVWFNLT